MAAVSSPAPEERGSKRLKGEEDGGPPPPSEDGMAPAPYSQQMPPSLGPPQQQQQQRYTPNPYGGPPPPPGPHPGSHPGPHPMQQATGYMWGQYGNAPPPPHSWGPATGNHHTAGPMYQQRGPMSPDRPGNWNGYRNPAPQPPHQPGKMPGRKGKNSKSSKDDGPGGDIDDGNMNGHPPPPQQPQQGPPQPYWAHGPTQWQPQHQYGPPPGSWQAGHAPPPPPPPMPQPMYANQGTWTGGGGKTPPRGGRQRDSGMMGGYGARAPEVDLSYMTSRPVGTPLDDDGASSSAGGSATKEKGRGSYKCGRCGVPKKGHVCPYQPKLKRRPDEPPPEMRNAAVQVEMDEFMTLRRLNIKIQGFPESYATEPYMAENMVVGEPHPISGAPSMPPGDIGRGGMLPVGDDPLGGGVPPPPPPEPQPQPLESSPPSPRRSPVSSNQRDSGVGDDPVMQDAVGQAQPNP